MKDMLLVLGIVTLIDVFVYAGAIAYMETIGFYAFKEAARLIMVMLLAVSLASRAILTRRYKDAVH